VRILLTRPEERSAELAARLRELGHEPVLMPLIEIEPIGDEAVDVAGYDWLIVTSAAGAAELGRRMRGRPARVAAIGPATAAALRELGLEPDLVPRRSTQEGLLEELPRPPGRVLFAGAEGARRLLVEELGAEFRPLYRTRRLAPATAPKADLAVVASASQALALAKLGLRLPVVSIGPQTSEAARSGGLEIVEEAATQDLAGLVGAIGRAAARISP
jgi:uroporphyrinogen-III synthase